MNGALRQLPGIVGGAALALVSFLFWLKQEGIERTRAWQDKQIALMSEVAESVGRGIYLREFRIHVLVKQEQIADSLFGPVDPATLTLEQRTTVRDSVAARFPFDWAKTMEEEAHASQMRPLLIMTQVLFDETTRNAASRLSELLTDNGTLALVTGTHTPAVDEEPLDTKLAGTFHRRAYDALSALLSSMRREISETVRPWWVTVLDLVPVIVSVLALLIARSSQLANEQRNAIAKAPEQIKIRRSVTKFLDGAWSGRPTPRAAREVARRIDDACIWFGPEVEPILDEVWNYVDEVQGLRKLKDDAEAEGRQWNTASAARYRELFDQHDSLKQKLERAFAPYLELQRP